MPINVESAKASRRPASFVDALRLVVPASPSKFGTAFTFSPKMRLSLKLRPRAEGVDDHGRSGPSNEAASSIVGTGLMDEKNSHGWSCDANLASPFPIPLCIWLQCGK